MEPHGNHNHRPGHTNETDNERMTDRDQRNDADDQQFVSEDKYLAMEQQGVTYTQDPAHVANTDSTTPETAGQPSDMWEADVPVSRNSDAFNQDDYILRDNIDLDEDQSQSISSDDFDTNTLDETR